MNQPRLSKILLVDDEAFIRTTIKHMLRNVAQYGALQVFEARDGETALTLVRSSAPDLIICDIGMAPMSGLDFVKELRGLADPALRQTPVIMLTADANEGTVVEAMRVGANGYLLKPVSANQLRARMEATFKRTFPPQGLAEPTRPIAS